MDNFLTAVLAISESSLLRFVIIIAVLVILGALALGYYKEHIS